MKLKKFKEKDPTYIGMIIVSTMLVILTAVLIFYKSFALYEQKNSFEIINGQVPDQNYDAMVSFYLDDGNGNQSFLESMPTENGHNYKVTVICDNGATGEWDYENWLAKISTTTSRTKCKLYFKAVKNVINDSNVGDYVYYKPSISSYTTNASYVGGSSYTTTINPSELTMWRVIRKNEDGSIEVVSENISSTTVTFYGTTGYKNFIGQLNLVAKTYEDERFTMGSRHMGYSNQEEFIISITSANRNDSGYGTDTNLVKTALGTLVANKVGTSALTAYWLASRSYNNSPSTYAYYGWYIRNDGSTYRTEFYDTNGNRYYSPSYAVRPILTLKSELPVEGDGTSNSPWKVN